MRKKNCLNCEYHTENETCCALKELEGLKGDFDLPSDWFIEDANLLCDLHEWKTEKKSRNDFISKERIMKIYALKMKGVLECLKHVDGYHSVWNDKSVAEDYAKKLNSLYGREYKYYVEKAKPVEVSKSGQVRFEDSGGFMIINTKKGELYGSSLRMHP